MGRYAIEGCPRSEVRWERLFRLPTSACTAPALDGIHRSSGAAGQVGDVEAGVAGDALKSTDPIDLIELATDVENLLQIHRDIVQGIHGVVRGAEGLSPLAGLEHREILLGVDRGATPDAGNHRTDVGE